MEKLSHQRTEDLPDPRKTSLSMLYMFLPSKINTQSNIETVACTTSAGLWHPRLGHLVYDYVKALFPNERQKIDLCNICIHSKQKRAANRAVHPFQLIHPDNCTIATPSLSGSRYYLLFIGDFIRWKFGFSLNQKTL